MDLAILLDEAITTPLHQQLYEALRQAVLTGKLIPGERLPSTRALATSLGISRGTAKLSYEQLLSEGYIETVMGSGTFVCQHIPEPSPLAMPPQPHCSGALATTGLSTYAQNFAHRALPKPSNRNPAIDFCYWQPAFDHFPLTIWRKLTTRRLQSPDSLDYSADLLGQKELREAIAHYLVRSRAVHCDAEQVIIVNGTQQALDLIARLFINPGDSVVIEDPGYLSARRIFHSQGAEVLPLPVDTAGLIVEPLQSMSAPIKLVYTTPSHQFPTGTILSLPRRLELLAWAQQRGAIIIEDDYDSEYRYGERPIPAMQGLDQHNSVIYVGTFSKVLFPALRIGYLVLPPGLVKIFAQAKRLLDRHSPSLEQLVLADFINQGHLERHLRRMRTLYGKRRQALLNSLQTKLGKHVSILGDAAGIHLMVQLHTNISDQDILTFGAQRGLGLTSAASFYLKPGGKGEFLFGYANLAPEKIDQGIEQLAQILGV
ncbi:MAG: PLP-dependent aminotransferase family protein [Cyanobacteria bacterium P01_A01_bin.123]